MSAPAFLSILRPNGVEIVHTWIVGRFAWIAAPDDERVVLAAGEELTITVHGPGRIREVVVDMRTRAERGLEGPAAHVGDEGGKS